MSLGILKGVFGGREEGVYENPGFRGGGGVRSANGYFGPPVRVSRCPSLSHRRQTWKSRSRTRANPTRLENSPAPYVIRGEIFQTNSWVNFAGDFWVDFLGPFSLQKTGGKNPPKNPQQNSNQNLGVSRPKSTLQESALDRLIP